MSTFGELTANNLGLPIKHGGIEGTITSLRHFIDHEDTRRTIVFVKIQLPPGQERKPDHREISALATDQIGSKA